MPGKIRERRLEQKIREWGGIEAVCYEPFENGTDIQAIADGITERLRKEGVPEGTVACSRSSVSRLMRKTPARQARMALARKEHADAKGDRRLKIAGDVREDRDAIAKAKLQIEVLRDQMKFADPETYGEKKTEGGVNILNLGALHLAAVSDPDVVRHARERFEASRAPEPLLEKKTPRALPPASTALLIRDLDRAAVRKAEVDRLVGELGVSREEAEREVNAVLRRRGGTSGNEPTSQVPFVPGLGARLVKDAREEPDD